MCAGSVSASQAALAHCGGLRRLLLGVAWPADTTLLGCSRARRLAVTNCRCFLLVLRRFLLVLQVRDAPNRKIVKKRSPRAKATAKA